MQSLYPNKDGYMHDRSSIVRKYAETKSKLYMTLAEAEALSVELAERIRQKIIPEMPDNQLIVAGIANGGLMVAKIVSETLGSPFEAIKIRRSGSRLKRRLGRYGWIVRFAEILRRSRLVKQVWRRMSNRMKNLEFETDGKYSTEASQQFVSFKGKHVILIDDCILSGQTIQLAKKTLLEAGSIDVLTGVLTLKNTEKDRDKSKQFDPIVYLNTRIAHYPWSQNNKDYENFLNWLNGRGIKPWK
jgi:hypoxanthine phosphoribosyltransferase